MNRHVVHSFHVRNIDIFIAKLKSLAKSSGLYICPPTCLVLWLISNCSPIITDECLFTGYIVLTKHNKTNCPWKIKKSFPKDLVNNYSTAQNFISCFILRLPHSTKRTQTCLKHIRLQCCVAYYSMFSLLNTHQDCLKVLWRVVLCILDV